MIGQKGYPHRTEVDGKRYGLGEGFTMKAGERREMRPTF